MIHLFKEEHLKEVCPACGEKHDKDNGWKPEFDDEFHYKTRRCSKCEHKIFFKTEEFNSGHY